MRRPFFYFMGEPMPWHVEKKDDEYCVIKDDDGSVEGCHTTREKANAQLAALNIAEQEKDMNKDKDTTPDEPTNDKGLIAGPGIPDGTGPLCSDVVGVGAADMGPVSFSELKAEEAALQASLEVNLMASEFPRMVRRIFNRPDVEDKDGALATLANEFVTLARETMETEIKEAAEKQKPMKTVGGEKYPASDFLVVEDAQKSTTWHLQVSRNGKPDRGLASAAWAALFSPGGHRGNQYQGPNKTGAQTKLRAFYRKNDWELPDTKKETTGLFAQVVDALKGIIPQDDEPQPDSGLMLWKEADGTYRWLARYSNNFRDEDSPPEIISAKSHQRFVDLVDNKEEPPPELWLWHVKDWKWGTANWVAYDDAGFALAGGTVNKGFEPLAEHLMALDPESLRVSHGMPISSIARDPDDPSIIVEHITREISPLPAWAAANSLTGFILSKEATMAIPDEKRQALQEEWNLPDTLLGSLEAANAADKETAEEANIESKEKDDGTTEETRPTEEAATEEQPLSRAELGQVVTAIAESLTALTQQQAALAGEVKALKEKAAEQDEETLTDLFQRAIGHEHARVDGRSSLAKAGPKQTEPDATDGQGIIATGNPFVDSMVSDLVTGKWAEGFAPGQEV